MKGGFPMRIRYIPADPAGNLTGLVLTRVPAQRRAALAARLMAVCPEGFEQIAFLDEDSLVGPLPRMEMMGGEFCGNASRAFGLLAAQRRGRSETELAVSVSGAAEPVRVRLDPARGCAYADMPLPTACLRIEAAGRALDVVRMEGIDHAIVPDSAPSQALAEAVLAAMPPAPAQGVLFLDEARMTPFVYVVATGTGVWESSCGSGSVALAWALCRGRADGTHVFAFDEPGGCIEVEVRMEHGRVVCAMMGGTVSLGEEKEVEMGEG